MKISEGAGSNFDPSFRKFPGPKNKHSDTVEVGPLIDLKPAKPWVNGIDNPDYYLLVSPKDMDPFYRL